MKSYNHLYEECLLYDNRKQAIKMARKSKRIRKIIKKRHLSEDALIDLAYEWVTKFQNAPHTPIEIYDGISRKVRHIIVPTLEELIVQHCIVNALKPMFTKGMYLHTYASIPGRGPHKAKKFIERWIRDDPRNTKYVLKMDIRHFFDEVPHDILKRKLAESIHDENMLYLLNKIIDVTDTGIPLDSIRLSGSRIGICRSSITSSKKNSTRFTMSATWTTWLYLEQIRNLCTVCVRGSIRTLELI